MERCIYISYTYILVTILNHFIMNIFLIDLGAFLKQILKTVKSTYVARIDHCATLNTCIPSRRKFAPRCCVCKLPIMPEPGQDETVRVVALDRSFHIQCYKCEDCGLVLSSDSEGRGCYPLDDHVLCKSCNATRVQALTSHMTTEL